MDKKKFLTVMGIAIFAIAIAFNLNANLKSNAELDLVLDNVEALAIGEDVSGHITCSGEGGLYCYLTNKTEYKEIHITQ